MRGLVYGYDQMVADWVASQLERPGMFKKDYAAIGVSRAQELIAGVVYNNWRGSDCELTIASIRRDWMLPHPTILSALLAYPFEQLGCVRISATIAKRNNSARKFVTRIGFELEGKKRNGFPADDAMLYGMLRNDYEQRFT